MPNQTESRKKDHVELVVAKGAQYAKSAGFDKIELIHNALPEASLESIDLSSVFLGKNLKFPMIISAMTGGYADAERINKALASAAQKHGMAFGLGSQRAMMEDPSLASTFKVRGVAPDVPIIANIGAFQLKKYPVEKVESLVQSVEADALAVHLNPLQEAIQPEGDTDFTGVLEAIRNACDSLPVPVVAKETGAGMSQGVAILLKGAGVKYLDVAGAGGTSWSRVEYMRSGGVPGFEDWGLPTVESVIQCRGLLPIIASGGIRSGIDAAKSIALGADLAGAAYPFLKALEENRLEEQIMLFQRQMRLCAFLTGCPTMAALKKAKLIFRY